MALMDTGGCGVGGFEIWHLWVLPALLRIFSFFLTPCLMKDRSSIKLSNEMYKVLLQE